MEAFVHPSALVESDAIGAGTRIWAFAHVLKGAIIGDGCNIGDHCYIEGNVRIGNHVVIKNGVAIWSGVTLEDHVFVGPHAVFTNDLLPRAKVYHEQDVETLVCWGATVGANATLLCGSQVGRWAMIGAGSVVTHDVPDFALVYGIPARQRGWVCACGKALNLPLEGSRPAICSCRRSYSLREGRVAEEAPIRHPFQDTGMQE